LVAEDQMDLDRLELPPAFSETMRSLHEFRQ
jgi:hypothetical protein